MYFWYILYFYPLFSCFLFYVYYYAIFFNKSDCCIKAVFVENSVSSKSLDAVVAGASQQGSAVRIGGTLYTDALGDPKGPEGTYIGMMDYNVNTIIKALE